MSNGSKKLFLSAVSSEFVSYRELLSGDLKRRNLDVAVHEDIAKVVTGGSTLEKLDDYIRHCDGIVHLIGKASGAVPEEPAVAALLAKYPDFGQRLPPLAESLRQPQPGFSYTQWEAYLALFHRRPLFVYRPTDFEGDALLVPRPARFVFDAAEARSQQEHYRRISALGHDRGQFLNEERLSSAVLRDLVEILPRLESTVAVAPTRLRHTAERLIGRDAELTRLDAAWHDPHQNVVVVRAFGGMGKTSLVATWMAELALKDWRGAERVFDWSFYSQGTREQGGASADAFIAEALRTFGDPDPTLGSPWDRGARLAQLVGKVRCLLVLDGLEPLQHPPGPMAGRLKDPGIEALLKGLAAHHAGLCVVTTREKVDDIKQHYGGTADDFPLLRLTDLAGAALLHYSGARRAGAQAIAPDDNALQAASREARGHGLTLQLLGQYLRLAEDGDILRRDTVHLAEADQEYQNDASRPYGHAFKAMEAYEKWFASAGEMGRRQLAILKLLGLFDRPASASCLEALCAAPVIAGLTEPLVGLNPRDWNVALSRLEEINLLTVNRDASFNPQSAIRNPQSIDAHPLLREYFARQLRTQQPDAWREAHRRLYEHLCATAPECTKVDPMEQMKRQLGMGGGGDKSQPTLEDFQPLYQAVAHGCQAGITENARVRVFSERIRRGREAYSLHKLGAFGSDLGAIACLFKQPWGEFLPGISESGQAWLLNEAAFTLRAQGRLTEALEPIRAVLKRDVTQESWKEAASSANNLSELELTLGEVAGAVEDAAHSVTYADRSGDADWAMITRTTHADALHQAGRRVDAQTRLREAEQMQAEGQPTYLLLYSLQGFRYCDLLLVAPERAAWQILLGSNRRKEAHSEKPNDAGEKRQGSQSLLTSAATEIESCRTVSARAAQTLKWAEMGGKGSLLTIALDHLTLGRAALYTAILESSRPESTRDFQVARAELDAAVAGLRHAGTQHRFPPALLTRAWLRFLEGSHVSAQSDLDEAWDIAERGSMKLFMADIHLTRARLFGTRNTERGTRNEEAKYPWDRNPDGTAHGPTDDLAAARKLIEQCGYWRRKEELEDAEAALLST